MCHEFNTKLQFVAALYHLPWLGGHHVSRKSLDAVGMPAQRERTGRLLRFILVTIMLIAQPFVLCFHFETPKILRNSFDKEWISNSFSTYKEWISNILSILSILSIKALISGSRYSCACDPFSAIKSCWDVISLLHFAFALITHAGSKQ